MSDTIDRQVNELKFISNTYGSVEYFQFYFGGGKYSKEYHTPTYTY